MRYFFSILFVLSLLVTASTTYAQKFQPPVKTEINVDMSPENPGPNQLVSVFITSYGTNLDYAFMTYKVNGKTEKTGHGIKTFQFVTGDMNTTTTLDIVVNTIEGEIVTQTIKVSPTSVDLIWQSRSYVPAFYKGKALFSHQNLITFVALPHMIGSNGGEINAKNLVYQWKKNGDVVDNASGYGRDTYTLVGSLISRSLDISVQVTSPDADGVGFARIVANPIEPSIVFYEKSPLYGIEFQKALTETVSLNDSKEVAITAVPFYFGTTDSSSPELSYKWSINNNAINDNTESTTRVFRQKEGTSGTSYISLAIENSRKILQYASSGFNLKFGK